MDHTVAELYRQLEMLNCPESVHLASPVKPTFDLVAEIVRFVLRAIEPGKVTDPWVQLDTLLDDLQWDGTQEFAKVSAGTFDAYWPSLANALLYLVGIVGYCDTPRDLRGEEEVQAAVEAYYISFFLELVPGKPSSSDGSAAKEQLKEFSDALNAQVRAQKHKVDALKKQKEGLEKEVLRRKQLEQTFKDADADLEQMAEFRQKVDVYNEQQAEATAQVDAEARTLEGKIAEVQKRIDGANRQLDAAGLTTGTLAAAATETKHVNNSVANFEGNSLEDEFTIARCSIEARVDRLQISPQNVPIDQVQAEVSKTLGKKRAAEEIIAAEEAAIAALDTELEEDPEDVATELERVQLAIAKQQKTMDNLQRRFAEEKKTKRIWTQDMRRSIEAKTEELQSIEQKSRTLANRAADQRSLLELRLSTEIDPIVKRVEAKRKRLDQAMHELSTPVGDLVTSAQKFANLRGAIAETPQVKRPELERDVVGSTFGEFIEKTKNY